MYMCACVREMRWGSGFLFFLIRILVMFGAAAASGRAASVRCFGGGGARFFHHFLTFVRGLQHFSLVSLREQASIRPRRFADNLPSLFGERLFCVRIFNFPFSDCETRTRETQRRVERERHLQSTGSTFVNCFFIFYTGISSEAKNFPRTTQVDELCSALLKQNEKQSIVQKVINASIKFHCPFLMRDTQLCSKNK
jgi:hypothetical protein